jgi:hypothetical protein
VTVLKQTLLYLSDSNLALLLLLLSARRPSSPPRRRRRRRGGSRSRRVSARPLARGEQCRSGWDQWCKDQLGEYRGGIPPKKRGRELKGVVTQQTLLGGPLSLLPHLYTHSSPPRTILFHSLSIQT